MKTCFINVIFFIFTLFIFVRTLAYCIYEIKEEENTVGGISLIVLTFFSVIFANIMILTV